jgi:hypothetical protein
VTGDFAWYTTYGRVRSLSDSHPRPDTAPTRHQPQSIPCDQATDRQQRTSDGASQGSDVGPDRTPIEITSRRGDAVLLARADYDALEETAHLLRVPALATTKIKSTDPRTCAVVPKMGASTWTPTARNHERTTRQVCGGSPRRALACPISNRGRRCHCGRR